MEKSETTAPATVPAPMVEILQKKLVRQLDFSSVWRGSAATIYSEHPESLQLELQLQTLPQPQRLQHRTPLPAFTAAKPQSPQPRYAVDINNGTPKKQKQCNCKNSKCLKLYCECFASGAYCDGCNCVDCHNNTDNEVARKEAVGQTLERNPNAFRPKIAKSPHASRDGREVEGEVSMVVKHNKGCHCKKSGCLKKYCECFQANIICSENCRCIGCKNCEGSEERRALFQGAYSNITPYAQQAANAAILGAIGSSGYGTPVVLKKRKLQDVLYGSTANDQSDYGLNYIQQQNHPRTSDDSLLPSPVSDTTNTVIPKILYRSPLADILQLQDIEKCCSHLAVVSVEAAKRHEGNFQATTFPPSTPEKEENAQKVVSDVENGMPMSPATLALMCDERETMFLAAKPENGVTGCCQNRNLKSPHELGYTEVYVEQEMLVLTRFRDFLNTLMSHGSIKERMCSSFGNSEEGKRQGPVKNTTIKGVVGLSNYKEPDSSGTVNPLVSASVKMSQTVPSVSDNRLQLIIGLPFESEKVKPKLDEQISL